jgi:hypothetical protein
MASRNNRRPLTLLRGYSLLLNGFNDNEILEKDITEAELKKIKKFNALIGNKLYNNICYEIGIDLTLGKRMQRLYKEHQEELPLSYPARKMSFRNAFRLLLDGSTDADMINQGCSELQITKAKEFLQLSPYFDRMLLSTIGKQFGIARESVAALLKIYREKQSEMKLEETDNVHMVQLAA